MEIITSQENTFSTQHASLYVDGTQRSALITEKHPDFYSISWWGSPEPARYLDLIQEILVKKEMPKISSGDPYSLLAFVDPKSEPKGSDEMQHWKVEPPLTWQEIIEEAGNPSWFRYETGMGTFSYFHESGEPFIVLHSEQDSRDKVYAKVVVSPIGIPENTIEYGILSSIQDAELLIPMIRELSHIDMPESDLSDLLTQLANGLEMHARN